MNREQLLENISWDEYDDVVVEYDMQALVYDIGSGMAKLGFSGDDAPRAVFPSIVGKPQEEKNDSQRRLFGYGCKDFYVGDEAQAWRGVLNLTRPIDCDRSPVDYEGLEKMLHHCPYNELKVHPPEHPLLVTSLPQMERKTFSRYIEMLFEKWDYCALSFADSPVLSLYASGRDTGCVLESGYGITQAICVYGMSPIHNSKVVLEDQCIPPPRKRIAGGVITDILFHSLFPSSRTSAEREIARDIKEKLCQFRISSNRGNSNTNDEKEKPEKYELPDGSYMEVGIERFNAPEILFKPRLFGYNLPGIHEIIKMSIESCPSELHKDMSRNIVLSGGSTLIKNFRERLFNELVSIQDDAKSSNRSCRINAPAERKFSAWIGGSILSSLSTFQNEWVGLKEYKECGIGRVMRKCHLVTLKRDEMGMFLNYRRSTEDPDQDERVAYVFENYVLNFEKLDRRITSEGFKIDFLGRSNSIVFRCKSIIMM